MLGSYIAAAFGALGRNRLYAGVTIAGLAVGLAAAILIGLFVRDELSYDRWIPGHERVVLVGQTLTPPGGGAPLDRDGNRSDIAGLLKLDFPEVEAAARMVGDAPILKHRQVEAEEPDFYWADPGLLGILRLPVVAGRLDGALDSPDAIVLTRALARKYFGRDDPVGQTLLVNREAGPSAPAAINSFHAMRVAAVIEDLPSNTHLKLTALASGISPVSPLPWFDRNPVQPFGVGAYTYARLRPGASVEALRAALPAFVARRIPPGPLMGSRFALRLTPIADIHLARHTAEVTGTMKPVGDRRTIAAIAGVGLLIILIAAINFITLVTARSARRAVEVGVRKAVGARRRDLVVQFMGEAMVQIAAAMVAAAAMAELALPVLDNVLQRTIRFDYLHDPAELLAMLSAALALGLLAGIYPALVLSSFRPAAVLKGGPVQAAGSAPVRQLLVVVQFAILIGLILVTATLYRQTRFALDSRLQLATDQVLWIDGACRPGFRDRILAIPGVKGAACSSTMPLENGGAPTTASGPGGRAMPVQMAPVEFGFLEFYGLKPVAGRFLAQDHGEDARLQQHGALDNPSVVLNQTAARRLGFASTEAAVGRTVAWRRLVMAPGAGPLLLPPGPSTVVGVAPDFSLGTVRAAVEPMIFFVDPSYSSRLSVRLTGRGVPAALAAMDRMWKAAGEPRPMHRRFVDQAMQELYRDIVAEGEVIGVCAALAILIACLGLFALAAFTTERRTKEIGVRKAMGAGTLDVVGLLLWQFTRPVLWANLIAWPAAWWIMDRWLRGFAYRVDLPPWLFLAAAGAALAIAWATVSTHAWLVARARPVTALRYE